MLNLIKITEASNLAVHALAYLSTRKGPGLASAAQIAEYLGVSEAHLAKVLQRLARHQMIQSTRGAKGGFVLLKDPAQLRLLDVLETIDGPLTPGNCFLGQALCRPGDCLFQGLSQTIREHLERRTIADFKPTRSRKKPQVA
jgi:Rrf2 family transcriptional regulator, nitric oxide-sensitive transcriptional repressor